MFKKLKDKIAEEVKQSPLKSVQQLASAVVSPSSSSVFEPSSNDHFCIDDDDEDNQDTPKNSPAKAGGFTTVNLHGQTATAAATASPLDASFSHDISSRSRKSSISSVASDASAFFPRYEPSSHSFHLQSDLESASEVEDSLNVQLERVSKENLYEAYRKLRMRYNKYKGRFVDLAEHYRRLEKENTKCKNILLDTQDKALRRFSELREQCALEQEAKAHLEEALRSDLEEKDHLIRTLNTKIELLKKADVVETPASEPKNLMDFTVTSSVLEDKVKNLELMLEQSRVSILEKNEIIGKHQNELASTKNLYSQKLSSLTKDLNEAKDQIEQLQNTVSLMKKNEEESALSLAENKLTVHKELEMRDEQLKRYKTSVEDLTKEKDDLNNKVIQLQNDLSALNGSNRVIDEEKTDLQELSRGKSEAVKLMQQKLVSNEKVYNEKLSTKESEISRLMIENANLIEKLKKFEEHSSEFESDTRTGEQLNEKEEIEKLKNHIEILEEKLRSSLVERDELIVKISKCEEEIENLEEDKKSILEQKNLEIKNLELLVDNHKTENEKLSTKIECLDNEIQSNKRKEEKDLERLKYEQDSQMNELKSLYNSKNEELSNTIKSISNLEKDLIESQELKERLLQQLSSANVDLKSKDCVIECQKKSIDNFQSEIQQLNSKITSIDKLYNECQKEKAILEQKLSSEDLLRAEIIEKLKEDKFSVEKQLKDSENRIVRLENDLKSKESMLGEKNEENNKHHKTLEDLEKNIELLEEEIIEQKQKLEEYSHLDSELERLRKLISTFKSLLNRPCESADNGSNKNKTLSNHKSIISNIEEEGKILIEDIKCLQSQLKEKEERLEKMTLEIEESKSAMKNLVSQLSQNHVANNLSKEEILKHLHVNRNMLNAMKDHYNKFASETKSDLGTAYNSLQSVADNFAFLKCQITKNEELTTTRVEELEKTISSSISLHSEEKSGLYENLSSLESEMLVMKGNCQDLKSKLDVETNKCQNHEEKLGRFQELLEEKTKENNELKIVLSELEKKKDIVSQTLSESKEKMNRLESELLDKDNQLKTLLNQAKLHEEENVQTLKNGLRFLENEISNMKIEFDGELARKDQILLTKESECRKIKNDVEEKVLQQNILLEDKQHAIDVFTSDLDRLKGVILSELSSIDFQQESLVRQKGKPFISDENLNPEAKSKDSYHVQSVSLKGLESEVLRLLMIIKQNSRTFSDIKNNVIRLDSELGTLIRKYFKNMKEPNSCLEEKLFEGFSNSFSNAFSQVDILSNLLSTKEEVILNLESNSELLLSKNSELEAKYESMKAENSKIIAEIDAVKQNSNKGSVSNSVKLSNATSQLESARQEYVELQAIHNGKCAELSKLSEELSSLKKESDSLRERLEMKDNASQEVNKLASENEDLKLKIEAIEEDRNRSLKQLILEFNTKIAEKDEEIRAAEFKKFDRKEAEDNFLFVELKQQIKDLNSQLESSCESYEGKLADSKRSKEELEKNMEEIKNNHEKQMRDQDKKWRACLDRRLLEAERKYKEEIDELSKEWQNERKKNDLRNTEQIQSQELENSSRLAVAAMESGAGSSELLRKQVTSLTKQLEDLKLQHKHEMSELQKYLAMKKHSKDKQNDITIDDCTEMEYLRNILFEYMMGKEPVIMAKVLSAIVKFDPEQTNKILQKEEQKVSLLRKVVNH